MPRSISLARFSMRMRVCSLASWESAAVFGAEVFWEVTIPKFTGDSARAGPARSTTAAAAAE